MELQRIVLGPSEYIKTLLNHSVSLSSYNILLNILQPISIVISN
jgi:hypothetical protein